MGNACCSGPVAPQVKMTHRIVHSLVINLRHALLLGYCRPKACFGPQEHHAENAEYQARLPRAERPPKQGQATSLWKTSSGGRLEGVPAAVCADTCARASPLCSHAGPSLSRPGAHAAYEQRQPACGPVQSRRAAGSGARSSCGATFGSSGSSAESSVAAQPPAAEAPVRSPPDPPCQAQRLQALYALNALDRTAAVGVGACLPRTC